MSGMGAVTGKVIHRAETGHVVIMTDGGTGHRVLPESCFVLMDKVTLFTVHTHDNNGVPVQTYGYVSGQAQDLHPLIVSVGGVGAAKAFALISALGWQALVQAICLGDKKTLTSVSGIGPKMADNIISVLREKCQKITSFDSLPISAADGAETTQTLQNILNTVKELSLGNQTVSIATIADILDKYAKENNLPIQEVLQNWSNNAIFRYIMDEMKK